MKLHLIKNGYLSLRILSDQCKARCLVLALIVLSFLLNTFTAFAFEYDEHNGDPVRWETDSITMNASVVSFGYGDPFTEALETALNRLNRNPSNFRFNLQLFDPIVGINNDRNEVWFAKGTKKTPPAECMRWSRNDKIIEADVIFYTPMQINYDGTRVEFTPYMTKSQLTTYGGGFRPFKSTVMHEFGHALGLNHERNESNVMGQSWTHIHVNGDTCKAYFGEDAGDGAVFLYGRNPNAGEDVSVSHFRYTGWKGEYSKHGYTRMYNRDGTESENELKSTTLKTGEPKYEVYPGQLIQVEFTYENNGASRQTMDVGFYISYDNLIETSDELIATKRITVSRDDVMTQAIAVTVPDDLIIDENYYLGVIVDYTDSIYEVFEKDNATYHAIEVVDQSKSNEVIQPDYAVQIDNVEYLAAVSIDNHEILDNSQVVSADFTITASVRNIGTEDADHTILSLFQIFINDTFYQTQYVSGLEIGEEAVFTFDVHVPEGPDYDCKYNILAEIGLSDDQNQANNDDLRSVSVNTGCGGPNEGDLEYINENIDGLLGDKLDGLNNEEWGTDKRDNAIDVGSNALILDQLEPLP